MKKKVIGAFEKLKYFFLKILSFLNSVDESKNTNSKGTDLAE